MQSFIVNSESNDSLLTIYFLRRERDSNSRYRYQYVSLANWWFKPLTHLTNGAANIVLSKFLYKYMQQSFL